MRSKSKTFWTRFAPISSKLSIDTGRLAVRSRYPPTLPISIALSSILYIPGHIARSVGSWAK